ncbi:hypothetical protein BDY21DRAFT_177584 [Lineolata rhizophorae]|uniref:Uncharacterized protein n=1 Tax=Lineolata rhizophorae TaxID=578093 RepID=A0A6A6P706_9PEZI|nr:hypothetical protein BDY21DRAFT_177584 [Lineolata rhizophorae]
MTRTVPFASKTLGTATFALRSTVAGPIRTDRNRACNVRLHRHSAQPRRTSSPTGGANLPAIFPPTADAMQRSCLLTHEHGTTQFASRRRAEQSRSTAPPRQKPPRDENQTATKRARTGVRKQDHSSTVLLAPSAPLLDPTGTRSEVGRGCLSVPSALGAGQFCTSPTSWHAPTALPGPPPPEERGGSQFPYNLFSVCLLSCVVRVCCRVPPKKKGLTYGRDAGTALCRPLSPRNGGLLLFVSVCVVRCNRPPGKPKATRGAFACRSPGSVEAWWRSRQGGKRDKGGGGGLRRKEKEKKRKARLGRETSLPLPRRLLTTTGRARYNYIHTCCWYGDSSACPQHDTLLPSATKRSQDGYGRVT